MNNEKACNERDDNRLIVYNDAVRNGTEVEYEPILKCKRPDLLIRQEFPDAPAWQREQLVSGICSDKCWDELLGHEE
ncbi:MAG: hypothetical protein J5U17_10365 [Candidatus Methanoperedens sp.]|nr:hypothetical protein [Candidatus Methanoperedens sp.]MCE8428519.1 hypothetical protein [Candidatus Methanoperedens sp.]